MISLFMLRLSIAARPLAEPRQESIGDALDGDGDHLAGAASRWSNRSGSASGWSQSSRTPAIGAGHRHRGAGRLLRLAVDNGFDAFITADVAVRLRAVGCRRAGASGASMGEPTSRAATRPRASMTAIPCSQRVPIGLPPASILTRFARSGSCLPRTRGTGIRSLDSTGARGRGRGSYTISYLFGRFGRTRNVVWSWRHVAAPTLLLIWFGLRPGDRPVTPVPFVAQASAASPARAPVSAAGTGWSPILPVLWGWRATVQRFRLTSTAV